MSYAKGTTVPTSKSRVEIEEYLSKRGATRMAVGFENGSAVIMFSTVDRNVQIRMPLPTFEQFKTPDPKRDWVKRTDAKAQEMQDQAIKERWRALLLTIKAKFVSIDTGVETFDQAFLPFIMLPGGGTVGDRVVPHIGDVYRGGPMPPLLGSGT